MNFYVKTTFVVFTFFFTSFNNLKGQTPTTCFEIESILVDACGNPEGENEMVRFVVGLTNLNTNNLSVSWANVSNLYLGLCKNGTTANKVAALNNTIIGCGLLLEPTNNVLPAGSKVILFTSTNFNTTANSFANLNDTIYVIFQCAGNTAGHFANYSPTPGLRTLSMSFSSPVGCNDVVTYDRSLLVDQFGNPGAFDGAKVDFTWNNNPTYNNEGCNAPITINNVTINNNPPTICPGDTLPLSVIINGNFQSYSWSGGMGTYSSPNNTNTNYLSSLNDNGSFYIYFNGITTCGDTIKDSLLVQIGTNNSSVTITAAKTELCAGDSILLTATGTGNYTWSNLSTANSIYVYSAGTYFVTSTTGCGSNNDTITITNAAPINLTLTADSTTICQGNFATLTASGAPNFTWFNNSTNTSTIVNSTGNYYVIGYNNCYQDSQSISINVINPPNLSISATSNILCTGDSVIITAAGSTNYLWNTSSVSQSITVTNPATYSVSTSNSCFTVSDSITITGGSYPIATITGDSILCENSILLTASGGNHYLWSNNSTNSTTNFSTGGQVYVITTNSCGQDTAYYNLIDYHVNASFISDFEFGNETPITINFTNTSVNATNYYWTFGDGNTSIMDNPSNIYLSNNEYIVTLTASNNYCSDIFTSILLFETPNTIYIPNAFTPDNDGINDFFVIKGNNIIALDIKIFNRWGEQIHSWNGLNGFWDGTYQSKLVQDGTYFYVGKVTWKNNIHENLKGNINLLK
jgi:gliding motility-associated-like protein